MGGAAKCFELAAAFYGRVDDDPVLHPLFPGKTHRCAIEAFAAFLVQFLGGPAAETQHRYRLSLRESHHRFQIGPKERDAWMKQMTIALESVELNETMRAALKELFEEASAYLVNAGSARPEPSGMRGQLQRRWEEQRALDELVAAVRAGDLPRVIQMVEGPLLRSLFANSRAVFAHFAGVLMGSCHAAMAEYAQTLLLANPDLAHERYSRRTLLHAAAAAGNLPVVTALLNTGVDPNILDDGGHTPLYCAANECAGGGDVVRALIDAGAEVDACGGVKRCTPLHMAARRGNLEIAAILLACGANLEARDNAGETPLRRAVNCGQTGIAALLLAKGADPNSLGSKGLTPRTAARSLTMRDVFRTAQTPPG